MSWGTVVASGRVVLQEIFRAVSVSVVFGFPAVLIAAETNRPAVLAAAFIGCASLFVATLVLGMVVAVSSRRGWPPAVFMVWWEGPALESTVRAMALAIAPTFLGYPIAAAVGLARPLTLCAIAGWIAAGISFIAMPTGRRPPARRVAAAVVGGIIGAIVGALLYRSM